MGNQSSKRSGNGAIYHMLLVGETGSGKTSFLNLVSNIQLVHKLGFETSTKQFKHFNDIRFENPSARAMESKTTESFMYPVDFDGVTIGIVDTPGFGDTRGFEIDKRNVKDIVNKVNDVAYMHCICFVINGRQARLTPQFQYVVSEISAVLPKVSVKNIILVITNARDEAETNIDIGELTPFLGEAISLDNVFYLENPYCKLEKLQRMKSRNETPLEEIAKGLKTAFTEASETLEKILTTMTKFDPLEACTFMQLFLMKEAVEKTTVGLLIAYENHKVLQLAIEQQKHDIDKAIETKTLNHCYESTYTVPKLVIVYTDDHNTLCGSDGCNSNCHPSCLLPKQGDHKVKMCDKEIIRLCHCMDEATGVCTICGHSYEHHFNIKYKFERRDEKVTYLDEGMKEKYEKADKDIEELGALMKQKMDHDLTKAAEEVSDLSGALINKVTFFEQHASTPNYNKLIECQLMVLEQRIKVAPADRANSGIMCELLKTKEQLEKKLQLVAGAYVVRSVSDGDGVNSACGGQFDDTSISDPSKIKQISY